MILNHLWAKYLQNTQHDQHLDVDHDNLIYCTFHLFLIGFIPAICSYFSAVYLGWTVTNNSKLLLSATDALLFSTCIYFIMISGVLGFALIAWRLALYFQAYPSFSHCLQLSVYATTPIFVLGFALLYPKLWFCLIASIGTILYSLYLLKSGIHIVLHMDKYHKVRYTKVISVTGLGFLLSLSTVILYLYTY